MPLVGVALRTVEDMDASELLGAAPPPELRAPGRSTAGLPAPGLFAPGLSAPGLSAPGLFALDHVGLVVEDLDAGIEFHTRVLGLVVLHREVNKVQGVQEAMLGPAGTTSADTQIQLLAPLNDTSPVYRFLKRSGPGLQHLAYRVGDVESAAAHLRDQGLRLLYDSAELGTRGSRINFIHPRDAGGVLVELVESPAEHRPVAGGRAGSAQLPTTEHERTKR